MARITQNKDKTPHKVQTMWTYKGIDIFPASLNSSGIRWYARTTDGILRADSKASMRQLITNFQTKR
jgi:hypothetical protein